MLTVALATGAPAAAADKPVPKGVQQLWEAYPLRQVAALAAPGFGAAGIAIALFSIEQIGL